MVERVAYDEFGLFHENAAEFGLPYDGPPVVRRASVEVVGRPAAQRAGVGRRAAGARAAARRRPERPHVGHRRHGPRPAARGHRPARATATPTRPPRAASTSAPTPPTSPPRSGRWRPTRAAWSACRSAGSPPSRWPTATRSSCARWCSSTSPRRSRVRGPPPSSPSSTARRASPTSTSSSPAPSSSTPPARESSLRRGILHNALQREDGSWVWRYRRFTDGGHRALAARRATSGTPSSGSPSR